MLDIMLLRALLQQDSSVKFMEIMTQPRWIADLLPQSQSIVVVYFNFWKCSQNQFMNHKEIESHNFRVSPHLDPK